LKDKPTVTVSLRQGNGFRIYVLGKVNRPGEYPLARPIDVMQALALAGGLNAVAAETAIMILHRNAEGAQISTRFRYSDVRTGGVARPRPCRRRARLRSGGEHPDAAPVPVGDLATARGAGHGDAVRLGGGNRR